MYNSIDSFKPDLILLGDNSRYKILNWLFPNRNINYIYNNTVKIKYGIEEIIRNEKSYEITSSKIIPNFNILIANNNSSIFDDNLPILFDSRNANDDLFKESLFLICCEFPYKTEYSINQFISLINEGIEAIFVFIEEERHFGSSDIDSKEKSVNIIIKDLKNKYYLNDNAFIRINNNDFSQLFFKLKSNYNTCYLKLKKRIKDFKDKLLTKKKNLDNILREYFIHKRNSDIFEKVFVFDEIQNICSSDLEKCYKALIQKYILPDLFNYFEKEVFYYFEIYDDLVFWNNEAEFKNKIKNKFKYYNLSDRPPLIKPKDKYEYNRLLHIEGNKYYGFDQEIRDKLNLFIDNDVKEIVSQFIEEKIKPYDEILKSYL